MKKTILFLPLILGACATSAVQSDPKIVNVAVTVPCVEPSRPAEVTPLKDKMTKDEWDNLDTATRQKLLLAQAADRKGYGEELYVATAGCL